MIEIVFTVRDRELREEELERYSYSYEYDIRYFSDIINGKINMALDSNEQIIVEDDEVTNNRIVEIENLDFNSNIYNIRFRGINIDLITQQFTRITPDVRFGGKGDVKVVRKDVFDGEISVRVKINPSCEFYIDNKSHRDILEEFKVLIKDIMLHEIFEYCYWLYDEQSIWYSKELYESINVTENLFRNCITEIMLYSCNNDWHAVYNKSAEKNIENREPDYKSELSNFDNVNLELYSIDSLDLIQTLRKIKLKKNHQKIDIIEYFDEENSIEKLERSWNTFCKRRNHVAHNKIIVEKIYNEHIENCEQIKNILNCIKNNVFNDFKSKEDKECEIIENELKKYDEDMEKLKKSKTEGTYIDDEELELKKKIIELINLKIVNPLENEYKSELIVSDCYELEKGKCILSIDNIYLNIGDYSYRNKEEYSLDVNIYIFGELDRDNSITILSKDINDLYLDNPINDDYEIECKFSALISYIKESCSN